MFFDALIVVVLALLLYAMLARAPSRPAGLKDRIQLLAVVSALALNVMVLGSMVARISKLGSPRTVLRRSDSTSSCS